MNKLVALFALAGIAGWGGSKERDWQSAKLLDPDRTKYFAKENLESTPGRPEFDTTTSHSLDYATTTANKPTVSPAVHDYYIVETQDMVFLAERVRLKTSPPAKLAVTRPVKFAVDKKNLYLMNESGEEYQTKIVKQVEKEPGR